MKALQLRAEAWGGGDLEGTKVAKGDAPILIRVADSNEDSKGRWQWYEGVSSRCVRRVLA